MCGKWKWHLSPFEESVHKDKEESAIPQTILPFLPPGATRINDWVSVDAQSDTWTYFLGAFPILRHAAADRRMFQVTTSQLIDAGSCRQAEIIQAFGVSKSSVARAVRRYRQGGMAAFFRPQLRRRGGTVLDAETLAAAQRLLDQGEDCSVATIPRCMC